MAKVKQISTWQFQGGAVLLVSLIILLLLTIIGTSALTVTTLDTRISANSRDRQVAFQTSESLLSAGERVMYPTTDGVMPDESTAGFVSGALVGDWWSVNDEAWWNANGEAIAAYEGQGEGRYVIDYMFEGQSGMVRDLTMGGPPKPRYRYYRVTSRAEGEGGSLVYLQSLFSKRAYNNQAR